MSNQTKLDSFISSFRDEAELRTAILGLLERMPNTTGVRLTHGSQERGKDIVFNWVGAFGERHVVACVVKNEKITGSAESDEGARTVYIQAEQALDSPIANVSTGVDERVAQVYVISPHECPPTTVNSIKGKMQTRPGQVTFLCGRELQEKFEHYYPEFILFKSGLYGTYVADLEKGLDSDSAVTNVLFRHGFVLGPKTLTALYVRPKFCRELQAICFRLALPDAHRLSRPFSYQEMQQSQKMIIEIGRFTAAVTFPDDEGISLQKGFAQLADDLRRSWQAAFEAHRRRTDISAGERNQPRNVISLRLENFDTLDSKIEELLSSANPIIEGFKSRLDLANLFVRSPIASAKVAINSAHMLDYCIAEAVSRQVPTIVETIGIPEQIIEIDEALIDLAGIEAFITGPAGFGKTSFCKWQTLYDLKKYRASESKVVPIYVPLHQYSHGELGSFETTFLKAPEFVALWQHRRDASKEVPIRTFKLYLDGLDEVPSVVRQKSLIDLALKGKEAEPTMSIIVTGREHVVGTHLKNFVRIRIREFDDEQIRELATKWFENDEHATGEFFGQLESVPALRSLMRVPLLATLVMGVYRNTRTLPESRVSLYEMFVNLLAGGWDVAKNIQRHSEFGSAPKLIVLTKLAATLHIGRRRDCSQMDFKAALKRTLPKLEEKWQQLLEETIHDGLLVPVGVNYTFAHLSFQEYLAAKDLFEPSGRRASQAFREFLAGDDWWREVVTFYIGQSTNPIAIEGFVKKWSQEVMAKVAREIVVSRVHYLLEELMVLFPGAQPQFPR